MQAERGSRCKDLGQGGAVKLVRMDTKMIQTSIYVNQHRELCSKGQLPVAI